MDDRTMLSEYISSGSSEHDDDSTWDSRDIEYNNITDDSIDNDNFDNEGDQDDSDCESLKGITIPNSITKIKKWAFSQCTSLEKIVIAKQVYQIERNVFDGCAEPDSGGIVGGDWCDMVNMLLRRG